MHPILERSKMNSIDELLYAVKSVYENQANVSLYDVLTEMLEQSDFDLDDIADYVETSRVWQRYMANELSGYGFGTYEQETRLF